MKTIALCFSTPGMSMGEWGNPDYGKKYPGAGWMKYLLNQALSGASSIEWIKNGVDPKDVYIVQEENNPDGLLLQKMGCNRSVITCLESPIYASHFYDRAREYSEGFKHKLFFANIDTLAEHLYFPSFDDDDIRDPVPWNDRKFLCMVTANKHYLMLGDQYKDSPSFQWAMKTQLHDYRYRAIEHFSKTDDFDLYGRGWLPPIKGRSIVDKIDTIRNYKFALCFENASYPGYITEKIIDCFVAGVVPVYMGAPDVKVFIPDELFIDARHFKSFEDLEKYLTGINKYEPYVTNAHAWLKHEDGRRYNNKNFAKRIVEMCE